MFFVVWIFFGLFYIGDPLIICVLAYASWQLIQNSDFIDSTTRSAVWPSQNSILVSLWVCLARTASKFSFGQFAKLKTYDLVIATSKIGTPLTQVADEVAERWKKSRNILVAFGAPTQGLYDIVARENLRLDEVADFTLNTIPDQGTETVRTEEAVYASLALLNTIVRWLNVRFVKERNGESLVEFWFKWTLPVK